MNYQDRIKEATTTTGTGSIVLGGAYTGYRTFASAVDTGDRVPYCIEDPEAGDWETGIGTLTDSTHLARTDVLASSNGGALVSFAAGTKAAFCTATASMLLEGLVDPDDVGYDIVLCAGQSNMCGRGTYDSLADVIDSRVMQFGGASAAGATRYQKIFSGADPVHNQEGVNTGYVSPQTSFGTAYAATIPTNRRVLLVPVAYGGTALVSGSHEWQVGSSLYLNAISQANLAIAAAQAVYPTSRFVGTIWIQGESDQISGVSQAAYASGLEALIAGFRAGITDADASWFVIGGMAPGFIIAGYGTQINAAHIQVADDTDYCTFVAGPSGKDDALHYTAAGLRLHGPAMALAVKAASEYLANTPASAVDMTGPTSGVVSVASSNFTVSISGVITGTVRCTPSDGGAGGTFTPTYKDLLTGTTSGTFTYTPASTGAKTISLTNNGGLANPSNITYTVSAAATVPGAPTIGTATAGNASISIAFTAPASDGGSAITGYTASAYKDSDDTLITTASGASSPINVTGLTNGVAAYVKVAATNAVGTGAQSGESNVVTPAAPAASLSLRNMGFMAATTPSGDYIGTTAGFWGSDGYGTLNLAFQSGVDGEFVCQMMDVVTHSVGGLEIGIGLDALDTTSSSARDYGQLDYFLMHRSDQCEAYANGAGQTEDNTVVGAQNDYLRVKRFGSTITFDVSHNSGSSYTTVKTFSSAPTTALYVHVNVINTAKVRLLTSSGLA
jgi:hypothetical protein